MSQLGLSVVFESILFNWYQFDLIHLNWYILTSKLSGLCGCDDREQNLRRGGQPDGGIKVPVKKTDKQTKNRGKKTTKPTKQKQKVDH